MSKIIKRSITIAGHSTSVSLEEEFWQELNNIALVKNISVAALIREIDESRVKVDGGGLSSAIRVFILRSLKN
jgi:predicted DNA-binding ribbon-helix-helix protein